jgi:hypothetical protein
MSRPFETLREKLPMRGSPRAMSVAIWRNSPLFEALVDAINSLIGPITVCYFLFLAMRKRLALL